MLSLRVHQRHYERHDLPARRAAEFSLLKDHIRELVRLKLRKGLRRRQATGKNSVANSVAKHRKDKTP